MVLDDEDRENEGDLIINADKVTTEAMAFMVEHTSGVVSAQQQQQQQLLGDKAGVKIAEMWQTGSSQCWTL